VTSNEQNTRLVAALFLSPIIALIIVGYSILGTFNYAEASLRVILQLGMLFGWPIMFLCGLPIDLFLIKKGITRFYIYPIAGAIAGFLGLLGIFLIFLQGWNMKQFLMHTDFWMGLATSMIAASIYWLIRRPDKVQEA